MSELKPCPFCGGRFQPFKDNYGKCGAYCTKCGMYFGVELECGVELHDGWKAQFESEKALTAAINRRTQPTNEPLSRKHLRSMNDQSVWVEYPEIGMAAMVAYHADDDDGDDVYLTNNLGGRSTFEEVLEQGGVVYRRKPERSENDAGRI